MSRGPNARRIRLPLCALALAVVGGCASQPVRDLDQRLAELLAESPHCPAQPGDSVHAQLATLARDARDQAGRTADPKTRIGHWRVAAEAAWKACEAASADVLAIRDAGVEACSQLPQKDADMPRDCTVIRLSVPYALYDREAPLLAATQVERDALHAQSPPLRFDAPRRKQLERLFDDLAMQLDKVSAIRTELPATADPQLGESIDRQRESMYCAVVASWSLLFDVEGATPSSVAPQTQRRDALRRQLDGEGLFTSCGA